MKKLLTTLALAGALGAGAAVTAMAQTGSTADAAPAACAPGDEHHSMHAHHMAHMFAKHLAALKARLKLGADQESAWKAFADAVQPPAGHEGGPMQHPDMAGLDQLPTPERIDKMRALRKEHVAQMEAAMDKRDDAVKAFYAALNNDQKKVFDEEHAHFMHKLHHGQAY